MREIRGVSVYLTHDTKMDRWKQKLVIKIYPETSFDLNNNNCIVVLICIHIHNIILISKQLFALDTFISVVAKKKRTLNINCTTQSLCIIFEARLNTMI